MAKKRRSKSAAEKVGQESSDMTLPTESELLAAKYSRELIERLPVPLHELPSQARMMVDMAIGMAKQGKFEMIQTLTESLDELSQELLEDTIEVPEYFFCDQQAAQQLLAAEQAGDVETIQSVARSIVQRDAGAVDALVALGDIAETASERADWYRRAGQAAEQQPLEKRALAMPALRLHMVRMLIDDGMLTDAAEILMPAIQEDPVDRVNARFGLVDLTLRLGWHDELAEVLDAFPDVPLNAPLEYARAMIEFARDGASGLANQWLYDAVARHPRVARYLAGVERLPSVIVDEPDAESHASFTAGLLMPGLAEISGAKKWIRDQLSDQLLDEAALREIDDGWFGEERDPAEVASELPISPIEWYLHVTRRNPSEQCLIAIVQDCDLVAVDIDELKKPSLKALKQLILDAMTDPILGDCRKPQILYAATKADVKRLSKYAGTFGIEVRQGKMPDINNPNFQQALEVVARQLSGEFGAHDVTEDEILDLPQVDESWAFGVFEPPLWVYEGVSPQRSVVQFVVDLSNGTIVQSSVSANRPAPADLANVIHMAMVNPMVGQPRRPLDLSIDPETRKLVVGISDDAFFAHNVNELMSETWGIDDAHFGDEPLQTLFTRMIADLLIDQGPSAQALCDLAGLQDADVIRFYEVVANFYRAKPWRMVGGDRLFEVRCDAWEVPRRTLCVMGQLGQEFGVAAYDDTESAIAMLRGEFDPTKLNGIVVQYGEAHDCVPVDCWMLERHGWPLAGPEACPFIVRLGGEQRFNCPTEDDVCALTQTLPIIPRFLDHPTDQPLRVEGPDAELVFQWLS